MAFGLTGAPVTFQGAMNDTLAPGLRKFVVVFFDDILVYSATFEEHVVHLTQVFQWLLRDKWNLKMSKCSFVQRSMSYLDHVVSAHGVAIDPAKVQAILQWPAPSSVKELRSFLGLAGVGEFRKTHHPRNVEFNEVREISFSGAKHVRWSGILNLRSLEVANTR
jgi:hypothetical protein